MWITFPNDGRKLRKLITGLLKSQLVSEVKRLNYVQSYRLIDERIEKSEEKLLRLHTEQEDKVKAFLEKNFSEAKLFTL